MTGRRGQVRVDPKARQRAKDRVRPRIDRRLPLVATAAFRH
jgi:hypothetical protein